MGTATLGAKPDAIAAFRNATLRAMQEIAADPSKGLEAAIVAVPELASNRATQAAILDATIATWAPPGGGPGDFGAIDRAGWEDSVDVLVTLGVTSNPIAVEQLVQDLGPPA